jgi:AcrR family transcriptional regulator
MEYHARVEGLWWYHKKLLFKVIDQAREASLIRSDIPNKYIYAPLVCTLNWAGVWYRQGKGKSVDELSELYAKMFLEGAADAGFKRCVQSQAVCRNVEFLVSPIAISKQFPVKETFANILDTACALFARKGYFATSIREIASAMGIQKASLYYYISSKEDLIFKISQSAHEHLTACVNAALAQVKGPEERLYTFITAHVAGLLQHQNWHAAANEELMHAYTPERRALIVASRDAYEKMCRQILSDAQAANIIRSDVPVKYLSLILFGMITNLYSWYQPGIDIPPIDLGFTLADVFVGGISAQ